MLIKAADDRSSDLAALQALLDHPAATGRTRTLIETELRKLRAGLKGEAEAAYEIDFHHRASRNWAVIHDLRLEYQGRVAQIDHLLLNRAMDCWLCETKHFSEGVAINEQGEFTAFYGGRGVGVPSPIEQNRRHTAVLQALMQSSIVQLPTRLGIGIRPSIRSVVLVSKNARIIRPKKAVDGLDFVIKADQFRKFIERDIDETSAASTLLSITKFIGTDTLESFARQVARLHRPISVDWAAKFGLGPLPAPARITESAPPTYASGSITGTDSMSTDLHVGRLSTSKLAVRVGVKTSVLLERLTLAGLLARSDNGHVLTAKGLHAGAVLIEKGRYAPYFLWPEQLEI